MKFALITTTIQIPYLLDNYASNFRKFGWDSVFFVVAGDRKTPYGIVDFCKKVEDKYKYEVHYLDLSTQKSLSPDLDTYTSVDTITRRNFATLFAFKNKADVIVTIDDDNFIMSDDYLKEESIVGNIIELSSISSNTGWFNVCETLREEKGKMFFHRGFPINQRKITGIEVNRKKSKIVANAGLWLKAPDTDAVAWLNFGELNVTDFRSDMFGDNFVLEKGTWCPFNTQNTAVAREAVPAFFLNRPQLRYDDIWLSYVLRKIADHLGHSVSYGNPIVAQERNVHNYLKDLVKEIDGMERTPALVEELRAIRLKGNDYWTCTAELVNKLSNKFADLKEGYRIWLRALMNLENQ
jgi:hypothetical protein